jgi:hypothetical protein
MSGFWKQAEFWDGKDLQAAPRPVLEKWQDSEKDEK